MPKRKSSAVWDYFDDIKVDDRNLASSTNVAASSISSSRNSCKSFHDSMIEQANAARTEEASDATTSVIINIKNYLKKTISSLVNRSVKLLAFRKKIRMYPTLY